MDVKTGSHDGASEEKKKRKRQRKLQGDIRQQIEFYFSDANLRKDRFLKQEIDKSEDGYIEISTISTFNRIRKMTMDQTLIAKALEKSEVLEVSKDKTKLRRKKPLEEPKYNIDDVTVYVENLPRNVDHDMLKKAFAVCGNVAYISLPRYKETGDPKKFAFIEFTTPEEAAKACTLLNNPPKDKPETDGHFPTTRKGRLILPEQPNNEQHVADGRHSEKHGKDKGTKRKREASETEEASSDAGKDADKEKIPKKKKSAVREDDTGVGDDRVKSASKRKQETSKLADDAADDAAHHHKKAKRKKEAREEMETKKHDHRSQLRDDERKDGEAPDGQKSKKSSKKKSHSHGEDSIPGRPSHSDNHREIRSHNDERSNEGTKGERSVKDESKRLSVDASKTRKRRREDSSSSVEGSKIKRSSNHRDSDASGDVRDAKRRRAESTVTDEEDDGDRRRRRKSRSKKHKKDEREAAPMKQLRVIPKKEWLELRAKYLAMQKASRQEMKQALRQHQQKAKMKQQQHQQELKVEPKVADAKLKSTEPEFVPGVVLQIRSDKPFASRKNLREELQAISPVAYVDLKDGDTSGFVRLKSAEGAQAILLKQHQIGKDSGLLGLCLLSGQDEQEYWDKLRADRVAKLSNTKRKKKRGVNRILDRSEKVLGISKNKKSHVLFGDDD